MKLKLPDGNFRAYLFDCDGTIVNSMPLHYIAWKTVLAKWNCVYDEALFYSWGGKPTREIVSDLNKMQGLNMPVESVVEQKENLYFELLPQIHGSAAGPDSFRRGIGRRARGGRPLAHRGRPAGEIRHHRRCGTLCERQAGPGSISCGR
jgi:hypothetical protein